MHPSSTKTATPNWAEIYGTLITMTGEARVFALSTLLCNPSSAIQSAVADAIRKGAAEYPAGSTRVSLGLTGSQFQTDPGMAHAGSPGVR